MEDRRAFLTRMLAMAALLPAGIAGALAADSRAGAELDAGLGGRPGLPDHLATLDVRALGGGAFLVSGWVLTAADLKALTHAA